MRLAGTLDSHLHEMFLKNAHYCKGKTMFACYHYIAEFAAAVA